MNYNNLPSGPNHKSLRLNWNLQIGFWEWCTFEIRKPWIGALISKICSSGMRNNTITKWTISASHNTKLLNEIQTLRTKFEYCNKRDSFLIFRINTLDILGCSFLRVFFCVKFLLIFSECYNFWIWNPLSVMLNI